MLLLIPDIKLNYLISPICRFGLNDGESETDSFTSSRVESGHFPFGLYLRLGIGIVVAYRTFWWAIWATYCLDFVTEIQR